jgi:hypothetical protein
MKKLSLLLSAILLVGCAGTQSYTPPIGTTAATNEKIVNKPIDKVWKTSVAELGKRFFVINNLDKASGLINVSYSGSPESYVDCGQVTSYVKNARGERTYNFPASRAEMNYEIMNGNGLFLIHRKMNLEGRINLIFEPIGTSKTKVTANTKYVLTRSTSVTSVAGNGIPSNNSSTISFNSGGYASFPPSSNGESVKCYSTGQLEQELLGSIN